MSIGIKNIISAFFTGLFKKKKTKEQYMNEIDLLLKKADIDNAKKKIKTNNTIHEYEKVKDELYSSKRSLEEQLVKLEQSIISSDPVMDKARNIEIGMNILSVREIIKNIENRVGQINSFVTRAKEALVEQNGKYLEICTNLKIKKTDLISFEAMNRSDFDNSMVNDIKEISAKIESDMDEMEISRQAEKIFSDSVSGQKPSSRVIADDAVENVLYELINRKNNS